MDYLDLVTEEYSTTLQQADDPVKLHRAQGAIMALRKLQYLREEANV